MPSYFGALPVVLPEDARIERAWQEVAFFGMQSNAETLVRTTPGETYELLLAVFYSLTTDATVSARTPRVVLRDGENRRLAAVPTAATQAASLTRLYTWSLGSNIAPATAGSFNISYLPAIVLLPSWNVQLTWSPQEGGDRIDEAQLTLLRIPRQARVVVTVPGHPGGLSTDELFLPPSPRAPDFGPEPEPGLELPPEPEPPVEEPPPEELPPVGEPPPEELPPVEELPPEPEPLPEFEPRPEPEPEPEPEPPPFEEQEGPEETEPPPSVEPTRIRFYARWWRRNERRAFFKRWVQKRRQAGRPAGAAAWRAFVRKYDALARFFDFDGSRAEWQRLS